MWPMEPEEREAYERELAKCSVHRNRLLELTGDDEAAAEVDEAFRPLLWTPGVPDPVCRLPYEAPDLLP